MNKIFNIGIIGDAIVDEYFTVDIKGVSPEFPIPVMYSSGSTPETRPGGAANVANQFAYFNNVKPYLISFLDQYSNACFSKTCFDKSFCKIIDSKVPVKRRFYSDGFPTYRWDIEKENYGLGTEIASSCLKLHESFFSNISLFDALIFSDYDKGVFHLKDFSYIPSNILTIVDSKSCDIDKWFGCSIFKPNLKEAAKISGKNDAVEAGYWIKSRIKCDSVVITNANKGVTIISNEGLYEIKPEIPLKDAVSVIGAGDCFTAMLTLFLLEGFSIRDASYKAWKAGTFYVQRRNNAPITPLDLIEDKFLSNPELLRNRDFKLVFTNGCFDIIHNGHIQNLKFAKSKGDKLVVALNNDKSISKIKPNRPIQTLEDRIQILSSLEFVDYVVSFSDDDPLELIKKIKPDILVKGDEYDCHQIVGSDIVDQVVTFPMVSGCSTTNLIRKISTCSGKIERKNYDKSC